MPLTTALMGSGMPAAQAKRLGKPVNSVTAVGTTQTSGPVVAPYSLSLLTTAGGATACTLPTVALGGEIGCELEIHNISSTTAAIFPDSGSQIDLGTADTGSVAIAQNKGRMFRRTGALQWKSMLGG